ncbi:MAG TPA: NAD(P)/FAD-dependent oxidoreductase [Longimicrobiaceae bacterium]|nr:NAD(P)/FAD-dependent oxidoreductase [Longimicrobiaceae bacterium]
MKVGKVNNEYDAVVVGGGPNGLSAAIRIAQAGHSVAVIEARDVVGGAAATAELTLPGYYQDTFSAIHPLGVGSPFFQTLPLAEYGLEWIHPPTAIAHPLEDRPAALADRSLTATSTRLGVDAEAYFKLLEPFVSRWSELAVDALAPLHFPKHPFLLARLGFKGLRSADSLARSSFSGEQARALFAGAAAHCALPLTNAATAAYGLVLMAAAHAVGWPMPRRGSVAIAEALSEYFRSLGGEIVTGMRVRDLRDLPRSQAVMLNLTPRQILELEGTELPDSYRSNLEDFRYGPGVFKVDWALDGPIPWSDPTCSDAGTLHLAGNMEEVAASEHLPWNGGVPEKPFVLASQPSLFDATRAPDGKHTAWGYCHVPNGSDADMTAKIEAQVERFAPGFSKLILARHSMGPAKLESLDANLVGGDINGGAPNLGQLFFRPMAKRVPYATPTKGLYICSASTPPGGGVHGMCGFHAAEVALESIR